MLPLDTPRAFSVLLALLVATSTVTSTTPQPHTTTSTMPPPTTSTTPEPVSAWQEYLSCAAERNCVRHASQCDCGVNNFRCWEMCRRRCSCGCLGVPETILDHDVWDDCAEECRPPTGMVYSCLVRCEDQSCRNLCRAHCRCECIGGRNQAAAAADTGARLSMSALVAVAF